MRRACLTIAMALMLVPATAQAARVPDLTVTDAGVLEPVLVPGQRTKVSVTVLNRGKAASKKAVVRFFLLPAKGKQQPLAGKAKVKKIKPKKTRTVTTRVKVPGGLKPGTFSVLACVDPGKGAPDAKAGNDCPKPKNAEPLGVLPKPGPAKSVTPQIASTPYAADGVISRDGGTLSAYSADFKRLYTLVVPPNALANNQPIEIKPLDGVGGLPFAGGMVGGVQLEPSGLEFSRPAALIISGEGIKPEANQVAFGYNGDGKDFRLAANFLKIPDWLAPYYDPANSIAIPVEHFSGLGVAPATDLETARQLSYDAQEARDRLSQEIAKEIEDARDGKDKNLSEVTERILLDYLAQVILPEAAAASFSDAMYERAVRNVLGWERQRQLLGGGEELPAKYHALMKRINQLLAIAWEKLIIRAENRCYAGDFSIIARILPLERQRQLLDGIEGGRNEFSESLIRCFKFELRIVARVTRNFDGSLGPGWYAKGNETYQVGAKVPLAINAPGGGAVEVLSADLVGAAPATYTVVANTGSGAVDFGAIGSTECTYQSTGNTRPGLADVTQSGLGLGIRGSDVKRLVDPFTVLSLGDPQEEINVRCNGQTFGQPTSSNENEWQRNFMRWWQLAHQSEETNAQSENSNPDGPWSGPWLVRFKQTPWPKIGTYAGDYSYPDQGVVVTDRWEFVHTPPPKRAG
ncbi:MAG: hypothetical protein QOJ22_483 [Thermoleophilaceae bacterium]|nr:hypothetical protein [Thermoleophilaceae bacterium]